MISKINVWTQGILIATIIAIIIQLILPENKNKKYIKVVIGIYILFCIIHPVIGKSVNLEDYDLENYNLVNYNYVGSGRSIGNLDFIGNDNFTGNTDFVGNNDFIEDTRNGSSTYQYNKSVNEEFRKRFINDVNTKLNTMGYSSDDIDVIFDDDYNIKHLKILNIQKYSNDKSVNIKDVNISIDDVNKKENDNKGSDDDNKKGNDNKGSDDDNKKGNDNRGSDDDNKNGKIKESEKTKLKKYFGDTYKINENEIEIS